MEKEDIRLSLALVCCPFEAMEQTIVPFVIFENEPMKARLAILFDCYSVKGGFAPPPSFLFRINLHHASGCFGASCCRVAGKLHRLVGRTDAKEAGLCYMWVEPDPEAWITSLEINQVLPPSIILPFLYASHSQRMEVALEQ
uniref:Uncharacterized protein n=1 Tax=Micrurus spixii TaxID=129469 RepID=A0A2D4N8P2_9SAUR